jgi:rhamnosyltransferase subunit B
MIAHDFYKQSVTEIKQLANRAVVLSDGQGFAANLPHDKNILIQAYAPHSQLFPKAPLFVHHGGIGTTGQALIAGKPQFIVHNNSDQPDNAANEIENWLRGF